jgi:hypothetical protein
MRDLLWATLIIALSLGWWTSYRKMDARRLEAVRQTLKQRQTLIEAKEDISKIEFFRAYDDDFEVNKVDWSVLNEPILDPIVSELAEKALKALPPYPWRWDQ